MQRFIAWFLIAVVAFWSNACHDPQAGDEPTDDVPTGETSDSEEPTTDFPGVTKSLHCAELATHAYDAPNGLSVANGTNGGFLALERGDSVDQTAALHVFDASGATLNDFVGLPQRCEVMAPDEQNGSVLMHDVIGSWFAVVRLLDGDVVTDFINDTVKLKLTATMRDESPYAIWQTEDCSLGYCRTLVEHGQILVSGLYREGVLEDEYIDFGAVAGAGVGTLLGIRTANGPLIGYIDDLRFLKTQPLPDDGNPKTRDMIVGMEVDSQNVGWALWKSLKSNEPNHVIAPATLRRLDGFADGLKNHEDLSLPQASGMSLIGPTEDRRLIIHEFDEASGRLAVRISADANACAKWLEAELTQASPWTGQSGQPQLATNGWKVALATSSDGVKPTDTVTIFDCHP